MKRAIRIELEGSEDIVDLIESYIEDLLRQNTSSIHENTLDSYKIERLD